MIDVVLLASCDETTRMLAAIHLACDMADGLELRHELVAGADGQQVCCTAADLGGVVRRELRDLEHGCVSCTVREGLVPMLRWVQEQRRWRQVLVTLPVTAAGDAVAHELQHAIAAGTLDGCRLACSLAVVDPATLERDLLGDDLLCERGLALSDVDQRALGEALALQLDCADVVATLHRCAPRARALLEHVLPPQVELADGLAGLDVPRCFASRHDVVQTMRRLEPQRRMPRSQDRAEGVWTVVLDSPDAFHPSRLLEQIELLGRGEVRARGCFWVPSRPGVICTWDGAGGQLAIGEAGLWQGHPRRTRILVTGVDQPTRERIERAFADVLLTGHERATAVARWAGRPDGLEPWLGEVDRGWRSDVG